MKEVYLKDTKHQTFLTKKEKEQTGRAPLAKQRQRRNYVLLFSTANKNYLNR